MLQFAPLAVSTAIGVGKALVNEITSAASGTKAATEAKARKSATEFETMFLEQSLDRLATSDGTDGPLGENGTGGGVYRSMLTKEYAGQIVKSGGVGISDQIYREMMKMQEGANAARS